jgi:2',3'-cyclic-nucleotide 2'-phosphodiesterase (5'-nucleotidase family)
MSLVIYHTSDVHGRLGFGRRLAELAGPGALIVDCGDSLRGSSTVYLGNEPVRQEFAAAKYAAQAVGNREFHYVHGCFLARAHALSMPMICSNLLDLRSRTPPYVRSLTLESNGVTVRLLGLMPPQYRTGSGWERIFGWRFLSVTAALDEMLANGHTGVTILLSHCGLDADREIAARYSTLSAIIGGHSHETLATPDVVGEVPIVHSGPYARYAGRLQLEVDGAKTRLGAYTLVPLLAEQAT